MKKKTSHGNGDIGISATHVKDDNDGTWMVQLHGTGDTALLIDNWGNWVERLSNASNEYLTDTDASNQTV